VGTVITLTVLAAIKFGWAPVLTAHLSTLPIIAGALWFQHSRKKVEEKNLLPFHWSGFQTFYEKMVGRKVVWVRQQHDKGYRYQTKYKDWSIRIERGLDGYFIYMFYQDKAIMEACYDEKKQDFRYVQKNNRFLTRLKEQNEIINGVSMLNTMLAIVKKKEWVTCALDITNEETMIDTIIQYTNQLHQGHKKIIKTFLYHYIDGMKEERKYSAKEKERRLKTLQTLRLTLFQQTKELAPYRLTAILDELTNEVRNIQKDKKDKYSLIPLEAWDKLEFDYKHWTSKEQSVYLEYKESYLSLNKRYELSESELLYLQHGWLKMSRYITIPQYRLTVLRQQRRHLQQLGKEKRKNKLHMD